MLKDILQNFAINRLAGQSLNNVPISGVTYHAVLAPLNIFWWGVVKALGKPCDASFMSLRPVYTGHDSTKLFLKNCIL